MNPRRKRRSLGFLFGLGSLLVAGVLGTGCDVSPSAATVNGETITQSQLNARLEEIVDNGVSGDYVRCALQLQGTLPSSVYGAGDHTVSTQLASYELSTMILSELITQELARRHVSVSGEDTSAAREDLEAQLVPSSSTGGTSPCGLTGRQLLQRVPTDFAESDVRLLAVEEELGATLEHLDLSTSALESYYRQHQSEFSEVCLSDVEVASQSEAQSIRSSIVSGATSFGDAARKNSLDSETASNGGAYPCFLTSGLQNPTILAALQPLAPGQVSQPVPVATSTGQTAWLLLQLNDRPTLPFAEAVTQIRQSLLTGQGSKVSRELARLTATAKVTVDPRYGTWTKLRGVLAPVPPPSKFVLAPRANAPASVSS